MRNTKRFTPHVLAAAVGLFMAGVSVAAEPFVVKDIRVEGLQRVEPGTVFGYLPVHVGETFTDDKSADAIRTLYNTGFFTDVKLQSNGGVLVVQVQERPAIAQIDFTGAKEFDKELLKKSLRAVGIADGRYYDKSIIEKAEQELKRQYVAKGFYAAEITTTITPVERNRVAIVFSVDEGPTAKIKQINIIGNKAFSEGDLRDEIQLTSPGWFTWYSRNDLYSKQKLTADLETLRSFYLNKGYLEFGIESTQVSISPDKKGMYITINIKEGEQYKIGDVKLAGELLGKKDELTKLIKLKSGDVFSSAKLAQTAKGISEKLGTYGYAFASVNPQPNINKEKREVSLTLMVDPGKRAYVRRVNVTGNSKTRDEVVRREMRQFESAWYDGEKLKLSQQRINRTAHFSEANITTDDVPGTNDQVDVNVHVVEKATGQFSVGAGYSSTDKVVVTAGIRQDNIFGSGQSLAIDANTGKTNRTISLTNVDPYYTDDGVSRATNMYYRTTHPLYYTGDSAFQIITAGGSVKFGVPFTETDRVFFGLGVERTTIDLDDNAPVNYRDYVNAYGAHSTNVYNTIGWSYDGRDSALTPSEGRFQQFSIEVGLPVMDLQYYRLYYQHQYYYPLAKGFTLAANGEVGYGHGYSGKTFPIMKNYYAGGIGSVRGYSPSTLGPVSVNSTTGQNQYLGGASKLIGNIEFTFPLPGTGGDKTVRLFTFLDAGNVFAEGTKYSVGELRTSYGMGLSWMSPIGPLKLSYGLPLKKVAGDQYQRFQFQIGTAF